MKLAILLVTLVALTLILWLAGLLSGELALVLMGVGVGLLFAVTERETKF
jgi:hypothetical protein